MIEFLKHLGLMPEKDPTMLSLIHKLKSLMIWVVLVWFICFYQVISVFCSLLTYSFPDASISIKRRCCIGIWDLCITFMNWNGVEFEVTGDSITSESAVFISNHHSLVDHIAINYLSRHSYFINNDLEVPVVNFFTWFHIWKVPTFRILLNLAKHDENWELDPNLNDIFFTKLVNSKKTEWLVIFPEVNIFTTEASKLQRMQCEKFYLPTFNNLLYPRFSSLYNVVSMVKNDSLDGHKFNKLYDITIYYYKVGDGGERMYFSPNLLEIFSSEEKICVSIGVKFKSLARVSGNRNKLEKWLEKAWIEKDENLTAVFGNGNKNWGLGGC